MAFNPFDVFRRNQKILMSVIVIGVMFIFTLQFGKNDFFPYTRDELEKHDPVGFALMKKAWGDPVK